MLEEQFIQQTEVAPKVPEPLMAYVDNEISRLNERLAKFRPYGKGDVNATLRLDSYQQIKAQLSQPSPQYNGFLAQLQTEFTEAEQEFTTAKNQIIPISQDPTREAMQGDMYFFALQQDIAREKSILAKAAAALDADDKAYIARKIAQYKDTQSVYTRGKALRIMESAHTRMQTIQGLQPYLPKPLALTSK